MPLSKFESMLKTNDVYFFDSSEFEQIIQYYLDTGKHSIAKKAIQLGLEQHPTCVNLKLLKVELYIFEDKIPQAIKLLNQVEEVEPYNDEVFFQKASILSKNNQHKEAVKVLESALEFLETPTDAWSLIGMEYLYLDDYENARLNFAKCIDVDYEDYSSLYNIVYCFDMKEEHEEAVQFLRAYIDKNPYSEVAWHQLGRQYFELNRYKEALSSFDYAVIIDENFIGGYLEKAKTLEKLGEYEEAIENYIITLELDDPSAFAYIRIGECFEKLNLVDAAINYYKKAVHEDPLLDKGWILLTNAYFQLENYHKALYYINKAIEIDDANIVYWRRYAEINIKLDFYEEAVKAFNNSISLGDVEIEIYISLADVLIFLGDFDDALKTLIKAKRTYNEFAEIEYRLCGLFMILNKADYGLTHLKNGLAIDYDYHIILRDLFPIVFENNEVKEIVASFKKVIK